MGGAAGLLAWLFGQWARRQGVGRAHLQPAARLRARQKPLLHAVPRVRAFLHTQGRHRCPTPPPSTSKLPPPRTPKLLSGDWWRRHFATSSRASTPSPCSGSQASARAGAWCVRACPGCRAAPRWAWLGWLQALVCCLVRCGVCCWSQDWSTAFWGSALLMPSVVSFGMMTGALLTTFIQVPPASPPPSSTPPSPPAGLHAAVVL